MNFYLMLMSIVLTALLATHSNNIPTYIFSSSFHNCFVPAFVVVIKSELRDIELESRIKRLEKAERKLKNDRKYKSSLSLY